MKYPEFLKSVRVELTSVLTAQKDAIKKFNEHAKKGHSFLEYAIRNDIEGLLKLNYRAERLKEVVDAIFHVGEDNVAELLERILQDSLERGFFRAELRHNSTNEMDNIARRWKAEVEPMLHANFSRWQKMLMQG